MSNYSLHSNGFAFDLSHSDHMEVRISPAPGQEVYFIRKDRAVFKDDLDEVMSALSDSLTVNVSEMFSNVSVDVSNVTLTFEALSEEFKNLFSL